MAFFKKPSPPIARSIWSLWLGIALATLLAMVVHGLLFGLTFKAMAFILVLGTIAWLAMTCFLLAKDRASTHEVSPS